MIPTTTSMSESDEDIEEKGHPFEPGMKKKKN